MIIFDFMKYYSRIKYIKEIIRLVKVDFVVAFAAVAVMVVEL